MWLARASRTRRAPGFPYLSRRATAAGGLRDKLQAEYQRRIEQGQLETDHVQMRVIDFLATTLDEASMRSRSMLAEAKRRQQEQEQKQEQEESVLAEGSVQGWAGRPGWVLPICTLGAGNQSMVEDHARVAEYTARLAAENAQRVRKQAGHSRAAQAASAVSPGQTAMAQVAAAVPSQPASTSSKAPGRQPVAKAPRRSVYLHGAVGTGKTMLLDLFYQNAKGTGLRTLRQHFYEFMLGLHQQIHRIREDRPVEVAANSLADDIDVLCFDEFQITDIQDAAILPRLFEVLFIRGVAVVMTSNTSPQLLYSGGLNRHVHLPAFIGLMAEHSTVLGLKSSVDYRRKAEAAELAKADATGEMSHDAFLAGADAEERLAARWAAIQAEVGFSVTELVLQLPMGRTLQILQSAGPACLLSFQEICGTDRGEADFFALAERFRIILLSGVPRFSGLEDADAVRRFVKLLDVLYDRRVRLVVAAAAPPGELFLAVREEVGRGDMSDLAWRTAMYSADGKVGLNPQAVGTLCEAVRATERAESRLREMRTRRYWDSCADQ